MEPLAWITGITSLANMIKAWHEAKTAGLNHAQTKFKVESAKDNGMFVVDPATAVSSRSMRIAPAILEALVRDIQNAEQRFAGVFGNPIYTPAQIDQEEDIARATICRHIQRIKDLNCGEFPSPDLARISESYRCGQPPNVA